MELVETLNKRLEEYYSRDVVTNLPKWRIVHSDSQREKRFGTFIKETEAGLYLGEYTGVREVPKYPFWPDFWILEHFYPIHESAHEDLYKAGNRYSYEPIWRFAGKDGEKVQPEWWAIQMIIQAWERPKEMRNQRMIDSADEALKRKETEEIKENIARPTIAGAPRDKDNTVLVPSNYEKTVH